jgi:hypothetical protein
MIASGSTRWCARLLAFALLITNALADDVVPVFQTRTDTYKDVTLISRTKTHVFLKHSRGVATLKTAELDKQTLIALGVPLPEEVAVVPVKPSGTSNLARALAPVSEFARSLPASLNANGLAGFKLPADAKTIIFAAVGIMVLFHLFFSYCAMLICRKAGTDPGIMVWLPILQAYSLIRAAGMSGWWFLACIVPGPNIVAQVLWSIKIAKVRCQGVFTTIMLILPGTNLFAFMYLAFSGNSAGEDDEEAKPIRLSPLPA